MDSWPPHPHPPSHSPTLPHTHTHTHTTHTQHTHLDTDANLQVKNRRQGCYFHLIPYSRIDILTLPGLMRSGPVNITKHRAHVLSSIQPLHNMVNFQRYNLCCIKFEADGIPCTRCVVIFWGQAGVHEIFSRPGQCFMVDHRNNFFACCSLLIGFVVWGWCQDELLVWLQHYNQAHDIMCMIYTSLYFFMWSGTRRFYQISFTIPSVTLQ